MRSQISIWDPTWEAKMRTAFVLTLVLSLLQTLALAQTKAQAPTVVLIKAGRLIDVRAGRVLENQGILIEGQRIKAVGPLAEIQKNTPAAARVIDLSRATVLPGLADCHTHILLQGDITSADYDEQLLKESIPYRAIRATVAVRTGLMNGFTIMRDLETEGAMYADVDVKQAINRGVIPGPRMFVSTRAFSATGMYPLLGYSWELKMPEGVQIVDGADNIRKAVREQVKYGADWIKFYAEHGYGLDEELMDRMVRQGTYWCPTIYVGVYVAEGRAAAGAPIWLTMRDLEAKAFAIAIRKGVKIAYGTD